MNNYQEAIERHLASLDFGEYILYFREDAGLTQAELAAQIGRCRKTISRFELRQSIPKNGDIDRLAAALHLPKDDLKNKCRLARMRRQ